jgi:hypothetical protein
MHRIFRGSRMVLLFLLFAISTGIRLVVHDPEFVNDKTPELSNKDSVIFPDTVLVSPAELEGMEHEGSLEDGSFLSELTQQVKIFFFLFPVVFFFVCVLHRCNIVPSSSFSSNGSGYLLIVLEVASDELSCVAVFFFLTFLSVVESFSRCSGVHLFGSVPESCLSSADFLSLDS